MILRGPTSRSTPSDRIAGDGAIPPVGHLIHPAAFWDIRWLSLLAAGRVSMERK